MEKVLKYTENEINFDSVKIPQILYEHGPLGRKGKIEYNDDEVTHIDGKPFINAVDIDWNGIEIENNNRINTTADLINWIKSRSTGSSGGSLTETISVPITCYRWYHIDAEPHIPTENSKEPKSTDSFDAIPESKWSKYALNRPEGNDWVLYLCSGTKEGKSYLWESVTRISGIDGSVGEDSKDREWIYKVFNKELTFSFDNYNPNNWDAVQQDDYFGPNGWLWSDNPQGVSKENRFEYASYRDYKNKLWTRFSTPILWSHYGVNGIDGDGVEYCYVRTVSKEAPEVVVNNIENELTDEYKPLVKIKSLAGYNNTKLDIKGEREYYQDGGYSYTRCTDDPKGVDGTFQYEWVIVRKKDKPNDNGIRKWKRYSGQMSLWSSFTVNVDPAITIKDGFLWGDGDYIRDGDGNPIQIEGGDGSQGVETIGCPEEDKTYKPGTISVCENKVKIYYNDQWIDFGESSGSGNYLHVAYVQDINFTDYTYKGFTTKKTNNNQQTYPWIGLLTNDKIDDPNLKSDYNGGDENSDEWQNFIKYKWNYIKGRDGNGVEYVFLLTKEEVTKPGIDENTYVDNKGVSHNKQDDEFLPKVKDYNTYYQSEYWTDDPQQNVSETWPKLWKAIRKKVNGNWRDFYPQKIENLYFPPNSLYSIVTTNDTIVIDDLTVSNNDIENASLGELSLYYNSEIVENGVTWSISNTKLPNEIIPDILGNIFKLKRKTENPIEKFNTGQFYFYVLAKVNNSPVAEKKIGLIIKDISGDGSFYKLIILNDSLSYTSGGGSNNNQNPIVNIKKIRNGQAQEVTLNNIIYNVSDIDNLNLTGLTLLLPNNIQYKYGDNYTTNIIHNNKPINLPIELDSIGYQPGGYEITLYYNDEIVDSEHIDCIKDGANGVVSGYTITCNRGNSILIDKRQVDNFAILANSEFILQNSNEDLETGYWDYSSSSDYFLQNYYNINFRQIDSNDLNFDGGKSSKLIVEYTKKNVNLPNEFNEGSYDIIIKAYIDEEVVVQFKLVITIGDFKGKDGNNISVSPSYLIFEETENKNFNPEKETITVKSKDNTELKIYYLNNNLEDILLGVNDLFLSNEGLFSIKKLNNSISLEVEKSTSNSNANNISSDKIIFKIKDNNENLLENVSIPVYINRAESRLLQVKGELENFVTSETQKVVDGLDKTYVQQTTYNTDIEATEKKLRSEYTEIIKRAGDYNPNLFGFHKDIEFGRFVPFILGYGIAIPESLWIKDNKEYYGYIKNLGFNGVGGLFTISFKARISQSNTSQSNNVKFTFWTDKKCSNTNTVNINNSWQEYTLEYNLDLDVTNVTDTNGKNSIPKGELQIRTPNNNFDLYIRELKIERGNKKTLFCEAEEDLSYFDDKQLISNLSFNSDYISYSSDTEVEEKKGVYSIKAIVASTLTDNYVDLLYQNTSFNIKAGCVYTLSYWAKLNNNNNNNNEVYITSYLYDDINKLDLIPDVANNIYIPGNSGSIIAGVKNDGETFVRLSNTWKHYFIRFYATNSINNASLIVARYVKKRFNSSSSLNMSGNIYIYDIKFQEGYAVEPNYYGSLVEQTARGISLFQQTGLKKTGIDISTGNITVQADRFTIRNTSGQENMSVNESGDVEFRGVIKGTYNFKVQMYDNSGSDTIKDDTDYFMFNNGSYNQSATLPDPKGCPGRVINISANTRPSGKNVITVYNYSNKIPIAWYDNTTQISARDPIDFYDFRKVVVWADPDIPNITAKTWRVIDSEKY